MPTDARATIVGHITEPQSKTSTNGTEIVTFSVCTKRTRGQNTSETWWRCSVFGARARGLNTLIDRGSLTRGTVVQVTGEAYQSTFEGQNGTRTQMEIDADNVLVMLPPRNASGYHEDEYEGDTRHIPTAPGEFPRPF